MTKHNEYTLPRLVAFLHNYKYLILLIACGLFLRLVAAHFVMHPDVIIQTEWGKHLYLRGPDGLYEWTKWQREWPNHPPFITAWYGISYQVHSVISGILASLGYFIAINRLAPTYFLWFFDYIKFFGDTNLTDNDLRVGNMITIKLLPIVADCLIALIIYVFAKRHHINHLAAVAVYLFLPFSWYLSAVWGQSDQVAFLFFILAVFSLFYKKPVAGPILLMISINLKPTGLIFMPIFVWIMWVQRIHWKTWIIGWGAGISTWIISVWMYHQDISTLHRIVFDELPRRLFQSKESYTAVSAFNFWRIFFDRNTFSDAYLILGLSAKMWGLGIFALITVLAARIIKKDNLIRTLAALFVVGVGGWIFLTNMYERYLFTGLLAGFFYVLVERKFLGYWLVLSVAYFLNLYSGWWYPEQISVFKTMLTANQNLGIQIVSILTVGIYLSLTMKILQHYKIVRVKMPKLVGFSLDG